MALHTENTEVKWYMFCWWLWWCIWALTFFFTSNCFQRFMYTTYTILHFFHLPHSIIPFNIPHAIHIYRHVPSVCVCYDRTSYSSNIKLWFCKFNELLSH